MKKGWSVSASCFVIAVRILVSFEHGHGASLHEPIIAEKNIQGHQVFFEVEPRAISAGLKQIRRCPQVFFHLEDRKFVVRQGAETASGTHGQMDTANFMRRIAPTHPCMQTHYRLDSMTPPLTWQYRLRHNGGSISLSSSVYEFFGWNVMSRPGQVF